MFKKIFTVTALALGCSFAAASEADAGIFYRPAPVRRVVARTALPPYPMARRVVAGPVIGPVYRAPVVYGYGYPVYGGVSVNVGW